MVGPPGLEPGTCGFRRAYANWSPPPYLARPRPICREVVGLKGFAERRMFPASSIRLLALAARASFKRICGNAGGADKWRKCTLRG